MDVLKKTVCTEQVVITLSHEEADDLRRVLSEWYQSVSSVSIHAHPQTMDLRDRLYRLVYQPTCSCGCRGVDGARQ